MTNELTMLLFGRQMAVIRDAAILSFGYRWHYNIHQKTDSNWLLNYDLIYDESTIQSKIQCNLSTEMLIYPATFGSWDIQN